MATVMVMVRRVRGTAAAALGVLGLAPATT
jgi:hypothetical protein